MYATRARTRTDLGIVEPETDEYSSHERNGEIEGETIFQEGRYR